MEFYRIFYTGLNVSDTHIQMREAMRCAANAAWCRDNGHHNSAALNAHYSSLVLRAPQKTLAR